MPQENWNPEGVSPENSAYITEKNWENNDAMVTSIRELESKVGSSINIPGTDASDDDRSTFYKQLGRPDNASQYGYKMPEGGNQDEHDWFKNSAHGAGLSDTQTQALGEAWDKKNKELFDNNLLAVEKETQAIKDHYGADYDSKITKGQTVIKGLGLSAEDLGNIERETGATAMVDLFVRIGEKVGESGFIDKDANPNADITMSKQQALDKIDSFNNDEAKQKLYNANDKVTVAYRRKLYQIAFD